MPKSIYIILFLLFSLKTNSQSIDSSNLPLVIISTQGHQIQEDVKITASMKLVYNGLNQMNHVNDTGNNYSGDIGIQIRGRYSASLPQKPYGIETRDALGANFNVSLIDMPAENDWILLANYNDKSFVRNSLAFKIFRDMGHWAPRTKLCEVIVNNEYQGIYNLTEKIKVDKNRINIDKLSSLQNTGDELTGGYVFSIDYYAESDSWKGSYAPPGYINKEVYYVYNFPKPEDISSQQKIYIQNYVFNFEKNIYGKDYKSPDFGYRKFIDVQSFIDYFIVSELSRNVDGYKKSCFYNKARDSKGGLLSAGPVWDFDWAWKNIWDCSMFAATDGSGWAYKILECDIWPTPTGWMPRLMSDPAFVEELKQRYTYLRKNIISNESLMNYIDSVNNFVAEAQVRHYQKWQILGQNVGAPEVDAIPTSYAGETLKFKNWITTRLAWLDQQMLITSVPLLPGINPVNDWMSLYPNPTHNQLFVETDRSIQTIAVYSLMGQLILIKTDINNNKYKIDIQNIKPGLHTVKLYLQGGKILTNQVLIE